MIEIIELGPAAAHILASKIFGFNFVNSLLVLQNFTTARKSGNIILTY